MQRILHSQNVKYLSIKLLFEPICSFCLNELVGMIKWRKICVLWNITLYGSGQGDPVNHGKSLHMNLPLKWTPFQKRLEGSKRRQLFYSERFRDPQASS